jgi:hypothetical protein
LRLSRFQLSCLDIDGSDSGLTDDDVEVPARESALDAFVHPAKASS